MKVVLDTNIIIGGLFPNPSKPKEILKALLDARFQIVFSESTFAELTTLQRKIPVLSPRGIGFDSLEDFRAFLREKALWVPNRWLDPPICGDQSDDKFLAAAAVGGADYLVSNDRLVLNVGIFEGVRIINSRAFAQVLNA